VAFYVAAMKKSRARKEGSGLGLARIWAEAEMPVCHAFSSNAVRISAVTTVPACGTGRLYDVGCRERRVHAREQDRR
jgi:hypothetical protein